MRTTRSTIQRVARAAATAIVAAASGLALTGCESGEISRVSILNESRTPVRFAAWPVEGTIPDSGGDGVIAANASGGISVDHPGMVRPAIAVRIAPDAPGAAPYTVRMEPPGPYLLRVRGDAERLTLLRDTDTGPNDGLVPADPHQRGLTDDIPRPNVNFGTP